MIQWLIGHPLGHIAQDRYYGADGIRGELLKLDLHVVTATIQNYKREVRPPNVCHQTWSVFPNDRAKDVWATGNIIAFPILNGLHHDAIRSLETDRITVWG